MRKLLELLVIAVIGTACGPTTAIPEQDIVVISVVGTSDVHGELIPRPGRGGITTFSGYVSALRDIRSEDGAVLLVDAGDMWQGTLESNLNEGAAVVAAYNAMGYAAAALGNHEFDFGPVGPRSMPETDDDDAQGALRLNATTAEFPMLAANLVDTSSGAMVAWENLHASTMLERAGVKIGIIGVLTEATPATTIAANIEGLEITPLADAITRQARILREAGASLVIVVAHAGSRCTEFDDPYDLSSCEMDDEIMRVAKAIPSGLVDHIVGGHQNEGIAHVVNDIAIASSYSKTRAFSRVDFTIDRSNGNIIKRRIYPPQEICDPDPKSGEVCEYEGRAIVPMAEVATIAEKARQFAAQRKAEPVGVFLETPILQRTKPESALGNLMTDAILESNNADISIHNVWGGIRAELPQGELTFGDVFRMFPFDNRIVIIELSGAEVRKIIARQAHNRNREAGFSGMQVYVSCDARQMSIRMLRPDGSEIEDGDTLRVVANDFLLMGGDEVLTPVTPDGGFEPPNGTPLVRDTLVAWFRKRGGRMQADDFFDPENRRWNRPDPMSQDCQL